MTLPTRKPNRLKNFDYSQNGAYFITVCIKNRNPILSEITVGADIIRPYEVRLSEIGKTVDCAIKNIPKCYCGVSVDNYVIMPNHVHLIITINNDSGRMVSAPTIVAGFKRYVSRQAGCSVWQKGFYDHVIRDFYDYRIKYQYIDDNPAKWREDELYQNLS